MKTYLVYTEGKSQKFWEAYSENNDVITRYGKIGTEGKTLIKNHNSRKIALIEMHKQIIAKRKKGYASPNVISMAELMTYEKKSLASLDDSLYFYLESSYNSVVYIDGDLSIDNLDLDALHSYTDGIIINGDLVVDGGIENFNGDNGAFLIVKGEVLADFVIGGGSEIYLGKSFINTFTVGHYNHGTLTLSGFSLFFLDSDHCCDIGFDFSENKFDLFDEPADIEKFVKIYGKKASFVEIEDEDYITIDIDEVNRHIIDTKKRLKLECF